MKVALLAGLAIALPMFSTLSSFKVPATKDTSETQRGYTGQLINPIGSFKMRNRYGIWKDGNWYPLSNKNRDVDPSLNQVPIILTTTEEADLSMNTKTEVTHTKVEHHDGDWVVTDDNDDNDWLHTDTTAEKVDRLDTDTKDNDDNDWFMLQT
jgi:hypothetical protein